MNLNSFEFFSDFWNDHVSRVDNFIKENGEEKLKRGIYCDCRGTMYGGNGFELQTSLRDRVFFVRDQKRTPLHMTSSSINSYYKYIQRDGLYTPGQAHDIYDLQQERFKKRTTLELSINDDPDPGLKFITTIDPRDFLALKM